MRGLRAERKGANPVLHLPIHHLSGDPEAWVILQTIRDARELGGPARVESMLGLYASAEQLPRNGPTAVLFERLTKLGWTVGGNGLVQDSLGNFSLMCVGWDELLLRFSLAWGHVMAQAVQHRSSFQGLQHVDLAELRVALRPYGPADLVVLRCDWMVRCSLRMPVPNSNRVLHHSVHGVITLMGSSTVPGLVRFLRIVGPMSLSPNVRLLSSSQNVCQHTGGQWSCLNGKSCLPCCCVRRCLISLQSVPCRSRPLNG